MKELVCFAYGANLDLKKMSERCPGATAASRAVLADHRFIVMKQGWASVVPAEGRRVHGILWHIDREDLQRLDLFEGVDEGLYTREEKEVLTPEGAIRAHLYVGCEEVTGSPRHGYIVSIVRNLEELNTPEDYRREVSSWDPGFSSPGRTGEDSSAWLV